MEIRVEAYNLTKRYPLAISRETFSTSEGVKIAIESDGIVGQGEMSPVHFFAEAETQATAIADVERWRGALGRCEPWEMQKIESLVDGLGGGRAVRAGLDAALHDWLGKALKKPVYALLGGDLDRIAPTSVTLGINPPAIVEERTREICARLEPTVLKVKLGSPEGIGADRTMMEAVLRGKSDGVALRVDANGGWDVDGAKAMIPWLAKACGVEMVEQPLAMGSEHRLAELRAIAGIPIYVDESCLTAADIPKLMGLVDGVNLKLMKAGGIREGLRLIHVARACGMKVMMGCMSESSLAIAASAHLSPFVDELDLDSHLNLKPDPARGLRWERGRVLPSGEPGLGISLG